MATKKEIIKHVLMPLSNIFYAPYGQSEEGQRSAYENYIIVLEDCCIAALKLATKNIIKTRTVKSMPLPAEIVGEVKAIEAEQVKKILAIRPQDRNLEQWRLILPEGRPTPFELKEWSRLREFSYGPSPESKNTFIPDELLKEWGFK